MQIIVLYKDFSVKMINHKKIKIKDISDNDIQTILVPCSEDKNTYIPCKPNRIYEFSKATVEILYQMCVYCEYDGSYTTSEVHRYFQECSSFIEFINAIYNAIKFRAGSMVLSDHLEPELSLGSDIAIYPVKITCQFFDRSNKLIDEIDSGMMKGLKTKKHDFDRPLIYIADGRLSCLQDILYIPEGIYKNDDEVNPMHYRNLTVAKSLDHLPSTIYIDEDSWKSNSFRSSPNLDDNDVVLYNIANFGVYYMATVSVFNQLSNINGLITIGNILEPEYDEVFPSFTKNEVPSHVEKSIFYDKYIRGNCIITDPVEIYVSNPYTFLLVYIFFVVIYGYHQFYTKQLYINENSINFFPVILFSRYYNSIGDAYTPGSSTIIDDKQYGVNAKILTSKELSLESLQNNIFWMIGGTTI